MPKRLSAKFERAMQFAIRAHAGQVRKGSGTPYITHPITVASLVMEYGGTEEQVIAALLHDVVEDCGVSVTEIRKKFGPKVARMVKECSDYFGPAGRAKPPWRERKEAYLAQLAHAAAETLLVSIADKLHNARATVHDARHHGPRIWKRFNARPHDIAWYYRSLLREYRRRKRKELGVILSELETTIELMERLISGRD